MANGERRMGEQTVLFPNRPLILAHAATVGKKEGEGPLGPWFDRIETDDTLGEKSWEKGERRMLRETALLAMEKCGLSPEKADALLGGDLLNQIVSAGFAAREIGAPFLGLYGACSTMAESLLIGAMLTDAGFLRTCVCATASHFSTAERQYRYPLELGSTRTPTAQWTVTGSGATVLGREGEGLRITMGTIGRVCDLGVKDANNMGAAMAPAAADTLCAHLADTGRTLEDYDLILTGDLGQVGTDLLFRLAGERGLDVKGKHMDCGMQIFHPGQDVHAGGSGCGCAAAVLNGWILPRMEQGAYERIFFMATGALLSPLTTQQGESIPAIAHGVVIERSV